MECTINVYRIVMMCIVFLMCALNLVYAIRVKEFKIQGWNWINIFRNAIVIVAFVSVVFWNTEFAYPINMLIYYFSALLLYIFVMVITIVSIVKKKAIAAIPSNIAVSALLLICGMTLLSVNWVAVIGACLNVALFIIGRKLK